MTESTEKTTSSVPTDLSLIVYNLENTIWPLCSPGISKFLLQLSHVHRPTVEVVNEDIIIRYLPASLTREDIDTSFIGKICHEVKHFYSDGDRSGKKSARQKLDDGTLLENTTIRMCLTYVYTFRKVSDTEQELKIKFITSFTKENPPKFIETFKRGELSDKEIEELRLDGRIIKRKRGRVTTWRKMSDEELDAHKTAFISTCCEEIKTRLNALYDGFANTASTPLECLA